MAAYLAFILATAAPWTYAAGAVLMALNFPIGVLPKSIGDTGAYCAAIALAESVAANLLQ
jgi:hypothetical protein